MSWLCLIAAGCFEVIGVLGISLVNKRPSLGSISILVGGFVLSFFLLSIAMRDIPMGTAYAIWTGIGAAGGAAVGMLWLGEPRSLLRVGFILMIIVSAAGLKLIG